VLDEAFERRKQMYERREILWQEFEAWKAVEMETRLESVRRLGNGG
jgi:hypothetical protein